MPKYVYFFKMTKLKVAEFTFRSVYPLWLDMVKISLKKILRFAHTSRCSKIIRKNNFSRLWAPHPNPPKLRNETDIIY
jgi:hypothetical protein